MNEILELKKLCCCCKICYRHKYGRPVFGEGSIKSRIMIVGRDPGYLETQFRKPFCGPSGKRLTRAIRKAKVARSNLYITNLIKCAPKAHENPTTEIVECCSDWLSDEIFLIKPKRIISLGHDATKFLTGLSNPITELRGSSFDLDDYSVYPTFHPSYVIRNLSNNIIQQQFDSDIKKGIFGHE